MIQERAKVKFGYENLTFVGSSFKDNFAQIGVYFQSLSAKETFEEPKFKVNDLVISETQNTSKKTNYIV